MSPATLPMHAPAPTTLPSTMREIVMAPVSLRTWAAAAFLLLNLPVGIFWFTVLSTLLSLGLGLAITLVGLPILVATGAIVLVGGVSERWRVRVFLGTDIASPHRSLRGLPLLQRIFARAKEPAFWRDAVYLALRLPVGLLSFTLAVTAISIPLAFLLAPLSTPFVGGTVQLGWFEPTTPAGLWLVFALGLLLVVPAAWALRGMAHLERLLAIALLGPSASEMKSRVDELHASRARGVDAGASERRRIERDLHDGAQQRLIRLAMDLGMAVERMKTDPASAEPLVRQAHDDAKLAIAELRDLARGIHPSVLSERGLDAALSALAARCPVPVDIRVNLDARPPAAVEAAAYFVISEALANVARHSGATRASVLAGRRGNVLRVEVEDNGAGGATATPEGGLAGLADRLAALDGTLSIESPAGGPTRILAEIPCKP